MPPKQRPAAVASTRAATQRTPQAQTGEIFKLPAETLFEIFSYFDDHRRFIHEMPRSRLFVPTMERGHVERSTVIRKLTMTCWALRNALLPVLWENVEGCFVTSDTRGGYTYGLYAQCVYLLSHPTIAVYVRVLSVDLCFKDAPKDLMRKFVDTLVRLPNLRTLELLSVSHRSPVTKGLKRKCAKFPNIREMIVDDVYPDFIKSCPNLRSLTFRHGFSSFACVAIPLYGAELKRVAGVDFIRYGAVQYVVQSCPKLEEIGLFGGLSNFRNEEVLKHLRQAKHLAVVEVDLIEDHCGPFKDPPDVLEEKRNAWKRGFIDVLKDSPSKDRKFFRWWIAHTRWIPRPNLPPSSSYDVVEKGELEVSPDTSL